MSSQHPKGNHLETGFYSAAQITYVACTARVPRMPGPCPLILCIPAVTLPCRPHIAWQAQPSASVIVMKQSFQAGFLRQLCTLAVPEAALVPAVIGELAGMLHLDMCCFNWTMSDGTLSHAHTAGLVPPMEIVERYTRQYVNREEVELGITTKQRAHRPQVLSGSGNLGRKFVDTVLHNEILKPLHLRYILHAGVFADNTLVGTLACNRMADQKEFGAADRRRLLELLPYVAMATRSRECLDDGWREEREHGVLVINSAGAIQHADAVGLNRLYRATRQTGKTDSNAGSNDTLHAPLKILAERMMLIERGLPAPTPEVTLHTEGRRFRFTARALRTSTAEPLQLLLVTAIEQVSASLRVLPWLRDRGLSMRQRELALHVLRGATLPEAARAMGVTLSTAQDYLDALYVKLGIKSREALLVQLHTLPSDTIMAEGEAHL